MTASSIGEPIPRGVISYPGREDAADAQETAAQDATYPWSQFTEIGLRLAFLPAVALADFITASTTLWQSWAFPYLKTSDAKPVPELRSVDRISFPS